MITCNLKNIDLNLSLCLKQILSGRKRERSQQSSRWGKRTYPVIGLYTHIITRADVIGISIFEESSHIIVITFKYIFITVQI